MCLVNISSNYDIIYISNVASCQQKGVIKQLIPY